MMSEPTTTGSSAQTAGTAATAKKTTPRRARTSPRSAAAPGGPQLAPERIDPFQATTRVWPD